jgi:hypothetical protein
MVLGKRKHNTTKWELEVTKYKGRVTDAHNYIALALDGEDYLHVAFNHHVDPLHYVKGDAPGSIKVGELLPMTGKNEDRVTYPQFYFLPKEGDLLFLYRDGGSGNGNLVFNRYITKTKEWIRVQDNLIDGEGNRNGYWSLYVDNNGVFHCAWIWRESPDVATNHDLCYARSKDGAKTWEKINGEKYRIPITMETADTIWRVPQNSSMMNGFGVTTNHQGDVFIAGYWDSGSGIPQDRLIWYENYEWHMREISQRITPFSLYGGGTMTSPLGVPAIFEKTEGDRQTFYYFVSDIEKGFHATLAVSDDLLKNEWSYYHVTDRKGIASIDAELWKNSHRLQVFVQERKQADHEGSVPCPPQMVYVMEIEGL